MDQHTRIGSSPSHTAWCLRTAKECIRRARQRLGVQAWAMLGPDVREAFVAERILNVIDSQDNEVLEVWRFQELVLVARELLSGKV